MLHSTEKIILEGLAQRVLTDTDLAILFDKSPASRYGLVNKALAKKELLALRRGLYVLAQPYSQQLWSLPYLANRIMPFSYVSLESALAYHGLIPERVTHTYSITLFGRNHQFETTLGDFIYYHIPLKSYEYFTGVLQEAVNQQHFFMATPLRALADWVYVRKINEVNVHYLQYNLRVEQEDINKFKKEEIEALLNVYRSQRVLQFLNTLMRELFYV